MSLKAFHVFFIIVSILFAAGFGVWNLRAHAAGDGGASLALGIAGFVAGAALVAYLFSFVRKLRDARLS
ncbi:MAG: hypothetical protein ACKVU1_03680 [bacterium]